VSFTDGDEGRPITPSPPSICWVNRWEAPRPVTAIEHR
jgi:hypothetical protein